MSSSTFLIFEVGLDPLGQGAVLLGGLRVAGAVGDDGGVGELLFQLAITGQGLFKDGPHGRSPLEVGRECEGRPTRRSTFGG